jgi:branched-chain amino acid transport system substrate-binding protein
MAARGREQNKSGGGGTALKAGTILWALLAGVLGTPPAMAEVSDGTVRVLVLTTLSGTYADLAGQGAVVAAEMAAEALGGEAGGGRVEILVRDTDLDIERALSELKTVHAETPVDLVTGLIASNVAVEVQKYAEANGIVTIHSGPSSTTFTNENCSPRAVQWGFDTYALSRASATATVQQGGDRWFFIVADYSFGHDLEQQARAAVTDAGGEVLGSVVVPYPAVDMTEALAQAALSGANIIGLANAGEDTQLAIRQLYELGVASRGINPLAMEFYISDIRSLGLYVTAGLRYATSFYWNRNERSRVWSEAFRAREGVMPTSPQAGVYSGVLHYLEAVDAIGSDEADAVMSQMRRVPVDDGVFADAGSIRADGRMLHDMLLVEVKAPSQVRQAKDYLSVLRVIPGEQAFRPMSEGNCPHAS